MIEFTAFNFVDYSVVFVMIISAIFSTLRGLTREFLGLMGWVVSIVIANYAKPLLEDPITEIIKTDGLSAALAWGLPFVTTVIIWFVLASLLSPGLTRAGLGSLDSWLGVVFGLARGYLLVLIAFIGAVLAIEGENKFPATIQNAQCTSLFSQSAHYFTKFMPEDYKDKLLSNLIDHTGDDVSAKKRIEKIMNNGAEILKKPLELLNDEKSN